MSSCAILGTVKIKVPLMAIISHTEKRIKNETGKKGEKYRKSKFSKLKMPNVSWYISFGYILVDH